MLARILTLSLFSLLISSMSVSQQRSSAFIDDIAVCVEPQSQFSPKVCSDGNGGVFIAWLDYRLSPFLELRIQLLNASGEPQWTFNGVFVGYTKNSESAFSLSSDGKGGVFIAWVDFQDDIYAQHFLPNGQFDWFEGGTGVSVSDSTSSNPVIVKSGENAIVAWEDRRSGSFDIYAQRIGEFGVALWEEGGTVVCDAAGGQNSVRMIPDDEGAILSWDDRRSGHNQSSIYAQKISSVGAPGWTANGVLVATLSLEDAYRSMTADGLGGVFFAWATLESEQTRLRIQRVDGTGNRRWQSSGIPVFSSANEQIVPSATGDGFGNLIVGWEELTSETGADLYLQSFDSSGAMRWASPYLTLASLGGEQRDLTMATDNSGGVIMAWEDTRSGKEQIFVQSIDRTGSLHWPVGGALISSDTNRHVQPYIDKDLDYGGFIAWVDYRNGSASDIFASHVEKVGEFEVTISIDVDQNWNLVSVPFQVDDPSRTTVFPGAISQAYSYDEAYLEEDTLSVGRGYWLKFPSSRSVMITGTARTSDTVSIAQGWNLIGCGSNDMPITEIRTEPAGLIASDFYGYRNSYSPVQRLMKGRGYWVKASGSGVLILTPEQAGTTKR